MPKATFGPHHVQIAVGPVEGRSAVGPDRNRRVVADVAVLFERLVGAGGAGGAGRIGDVQLQIVVGVESDDRVAVGPDRRRAARSERAVGADVQAASRDVRSRLVPSKWLMTGLPDRNPCNQPTAFRACWLGPMQADVQLQIVVGVVPVADDRVAVGPDRNRRVESPSTSPCELVPDVQAASTHTYNSKSSLVPSWWLMIGLPSAPIATDV